MFNLTMIFLTFPVIYDKTNEVVIDKPYLTSLVFNYLICRLNMILTRDFI